MTPTTGRTCTPWTGGGAGAVGRVRDVGDSVDGRRRDSAPRTKC